MEYPPANPKIAQAELGANLAKGMEYSMRAVVVKVRLFPDELPSLSEFLKWLYARREGKTYEMEEPK